MPNLTPHMKPIDVAVDMEDDERATKARVHYHEGDSPDSTGRSAEVVVYIDRRGLRLPEISMAAVRSAEEFLRRILNGSSDVP
jgi:hypothetical protein